MFKDILKQLRMEKGLLQNELALIIGKSKSTIGMYETGQRMAGDKTLKKLSEYFNVSIDYLFGIEQERLLLQKEKILLNDKEEEIIIAVRDKKISKEKLIKIIEILNNQD